MFAFRTFPEVETFRAARTAQPDGQATAATKSVGRTAELTKDTSLTRNDGSDQQATKRVRYHQSQSPRLSPRRPRYLSTHNHPYTVTSCTEADEEDASDSELESDIPLVVTSRLNEKIWYAQSR
jgi:hypothetical protein